MSKTLSIEEVSWRDIVEDANELGEVIVKDHSGAEAVVVPMERYAKLKDAAMESLRQKWDEDLAVLNEPGASEKLMEIFNLTPEEIAAAANDAERRAKQ